MHFTQTLQTDGSVLIQIQGAAIFSNFLFLKETLADGEKGKTIIFDNTHVTLIDHSVMAFIHEFQHSYESQGGQSEFTDLEYHEAFSEHPLAARRLRYFNN
ncbi:MAG: STAS domain-containing protein [Methylococcaceae bacterium]